MTPTETATQNNITESLQKAMSYEDYRLLTQQLAEKGESTGESQTQALANYTMLNDRRMKRLDKTIKLAPEAIQKITNFEGNVTWLVLTESWCGDAAQTLPILHKIASITENITLKLVLRDENEALMNQFLTNGGKAIPKLIVIDNTTGTVLGDWGPRPSIATEMVNDYKKEHGKLSAEFKQELQIWYNKNKGQNTIDDLLKLL